MRTGLFDVARRVAEVFEQLGIRYCIGGSIASGIHGEYRATNDADLVADILPQHIYVLKIQAGRLDLPYLRGAATSLAVADLLERAVAAAGLSST